MSKIIGIDIGAYSTKVIEASLQRRSLNVLYQYSFLTPFQANGKLDQEKFFNNLFETTTLTKLKSSVVSLSCPKSNFHAAFFTLPKMPKADLKKISLKEARDRIIPNPTDADTIRYDTRMLKDQEKQVTRTEVVAGSMDKQVSKEIYQIFLKQGVNLALIGSTSSSLLSFPYFLKGAPAVQSFIDLGFYNTNIVIFYEKTPAFIRSIPFGAHHFITAIQNKLGISFSEASQVFTFSGEPLKEVIANNWGYLISEIRRSFSYYHEKTKKRKTIERIIYSGNTFKNKAYAKIIEEKMRGDLRIFSTNLLDLSQVSGPAGKELYLGPEYSVSLGLVLSQEVKYPVLNFLPADIKVTKKKKTLTLYLNQILFFAVLLLGALSFSLFLWVGALNTQLEKVEARFSQESYNTARSLSQEINQKKRQVAAQDDFIEGLEKKIKVPPQVIEAVAESLPAKTHLTSLAIGSGATEATRGRGPRQATGDIEVAGVIEDTYEKANQKLTVFIRKLESYDFFSSVEASVFSLEGDQLYFFQPGDLTQVKAREFSLIISLQGGR